jgi:anti-sigma regulatory factor (Ser/Thr protein kinase)
MMHEAQFPAVKTSALSARRFVSESIVNVPRDVTETVALIASELATNSVRHAASAFEIRVEQLPDRIHIEVEDDGGGHPVVKSPDPSDTSGRGLQIVQALADEWGVIPKAQAPGKTVWVTIALPTPETSASRAEGDTVGGDEGSHRRSGSSGSPTGLLVVGRESVHDTGAMILSIRMVHRGARPRFSCRRHREAVSQSRC